VIRDNYVQSASGMAEAESLANSASPSRLKCDQVQFNRDLAALPDHYNSLISFDFLMRISLVSSGTW
jgi:hypothetical protein